jgi:hypothetical protein
MGTKVSLAEISFVLRAYNGNQSKSSGDLAEHKGLVTREEFVVVLIISFAIPPAEYTC